jgi:hypothetical protein
MGCVTKKKGRARKLRKKVVSRLEAAEENQAHVRLQLRDADDVSGFVVGVGAKRVELTVLAEAGQPDGDVSIRLEDVAKVRKVPAVLGDSPARGRLSRLEEVEELAQAVVDEAFEEGWPYDAQGADQLTDLQRAIRELACVVRRPEPPPVE